MKMTKLFLSLAIAGVTFSQLSSAAYAKTVDSTNKLVLEEEGEMNFSDVSPNHWSYMSIKNLVNEYKVLGGFPDGTFRGNRNLTRYEAAAMLMKVMDKVEEIASKGGKTTVSSGNKADLDRLKKEFATELEDLQNEVRKVSKDVQDLQKDLDETKDDVDMVKDMLPKVKVKGEVATRYEAKTGNLSNFDVYDAKAAQVRARIGLTTEPIGGAVFGARLSTGPANDTTNQYLTLGQPGSDLGVGLDMAYVAFRPWDSAIDLTFGRHGNTFVKTTELNWDEDLTFDGSYLKLRFGEAKGTNLSLYGDYTLLNVNGVDLAKNNRGKHSFKDDANGTSGMISGGGALNLGSEDSMMFMIGGNYHAMTNPNNLIGKTLSLNPRTNLITTDGKGLVSKYMLGTGSVMLTLFPSSFPITVYGDVSYNLGAGQNAAAQGDADKDLRAKAMKSNLGYVAGVMLGHLRESGNMMLGYQYKMVGTDSVFSAFNEDQLMGTGVNAQEVMLGIQFAPKTIGTVGAQMSSDATGTTPYYTLREIGRASCRERV